MRIEAVELWQLRMPLVTPFRTAVHVERDRMALVMRIQTDLGHGWAECSVDDSPVYGSEYTEGVLDVLERFLVPALAGPGLTPAGVAERTGSLRGHRVGKSALELAVLDAWLRAAGMSLTDYLGGVRDRIPVGVSIGLQESTEELLATVRGYVDQGYRRIKLKIEPGADLEPVRAVRETFGPDLMLQVDANASYSAADHRRLARLDAYDLVMIEQPLAYDDLVQHAELAMRVATPICLDESIPSAAHAAAALDLGAAEIVNIKPARVGGYLEARRIHDLCLARGVPVWCGGMLETGIGRAANLALASLPGFTLPSDISATSRYYARDITRSFELVDGRLPVPDGPGIGVDVDMDAVDDATSWHREWVV